MRRRATLLVAALVCILSLGAVAFAATTGQSISFAVAGANSVTFTCAVDSGTAKTCTSPLAANLAAGKHTVTVKGSFTVPSSKPAPPTAAFTVSPTPPVTGSATTFDATSSTCPGTPCTYHYVDTADGSDLGDSQVSSFTFHGTGTKFVQLTVTDSAGQSSKVEHDINVQAPVVTTTTSTTTTSSTTTAPPPPPSSKVGIGGAPAPTCATTVALNGNVQAAIENAASSSTVCLADGTWSQIQFTDNISNTVTLTAADPGGALVNGFAYGGVVNNLTVEGLRLNGGFSLQNAMSNDSFLFNTIENYGNGSGDAQLDAAFYSFPQDDGPANAQVSNTTVEFNQMDHIPQCLEVNTEGGDSSQNAWTFDHNVCGPGIGNNEPNDVHYTQEEGVTNFQMDNNAFIGPPAPVGSSHLNVAHICGSNITFDNNIVWHTETVGQAFLAGDDCSLNTVEANNDLLVEAPDSPTQTYAMWYDDNGGATAVQFQNDTVVNFSQFGGLFVRPGVTNFQAHKDLAANNAGAFSFSGCNTCSSNASDDGSGDTAWLPAWITTAWTPSIPWASPPTGLYQPSSFDASFGYQGSIGP